MASSQHSSENDVKDLKKTVQQLLCKEATGITILACFVLFSLSVAVKMMVIENEHPFYVAFATACIPFCSALLVASFLQWTRGKGLSKAIHEYIAGYISDQVKADVIKEIRDIYKRQDIKASVLPSALYLSKEDNLLEDQLKRFSDSSIIRFMSTSAVNLLRTAMPNITPKGGVLRSELLLINPSSENEKNIVLRSRQLQPHEPHNTPTQLKKEILHSVYEAYNLCQVHQNKVHIEIKFYNEVPFGRIELTDTVIYLSFYRSQRSKSDLGPVKQYANESDMYRTFSHYYDEVWGNSEKNISPGKHSDLASLQNDLEQLFPTLISEIREVNSKVLGKSFSQSLQPMCHEDNSISVVQTPAQ